MLLAFIYLCFDISRIVALGNKYTTISPSLPCFICFGLLAPVCLHLHFRTPFRHFPPLRCFFPLFSLSPTEDLQDKMHQGFYLGSQLALKTSATTSTIYCNPVELCLTLQTSNPIPRPFETSRDTPARILNHVPKPW